jgi:hypothetical protein
VTGYTAGDAIAGTVDVVIVEPFRSTDLVLSFVGQERVHMEMGLKTVKDFHREFKEIVKLTVKMASFNDTN